MNNTDMIPKHTEKERRVEQLHQNLQKKKGRKTTSTINTWLNGEGATVNLEIQWYDPLFH